MKTPLTRGTSEPKCKLGREKFLVMIDTKSNKNHWHLRLVVKLATGYKIIFTCRMGGLSTYGSASTANSIVSAVPKRLFLSPEGT